MIRNSFLIAVALLFAGCAGLRNVAPPASEPEERQVIQLIGYAQRVAAMNAEQQRREYSATNQAFAKDKDAMSRMRLALLVATPGASVHDAARAANLLEPMVAPGDAASPLRLLARLLHAQLIDRASEQKRASQMREQIDALTEVERTLRQQLDQMKEVERTIMQRGLESQPRRR
jgi:hypothetical protein